LKLGVKTVGCSGLTYTYDVAREIAEGDLVVEAHDAKLVVAKAALPFIDGSEVDYVKEGFKQTLVVNNPNVKSTCGCGESFNVT
jgi:iron-sulfur cluster assembly protein